MIHLPLCPYSYRAGKASPQTTTAQRDTYRQQKHCGAGVAEARLGTAAQASALSAHSGKTEKNGTNPTVSLQLHSRTASPQTTTPQRDTYRQQQLGAVDVTGARIGTVARASALSAHSGKIRKK